MVITFTGITLFLYFQNNLISSIFNISNKKHIKEEKNLEEILAKSKNLNRLALFNDEKKKIETGKESLEEILKDLDKETEDTKHQGVFFKVAKVIDGDTIKLENGEVVRYLGIDTPETVHPSKPIECFGKEASGKNKELVEGKLVWLEKDITDKDKYGRLLCYVWVDDLFVNDYLVRQGYAYVYTYPPDVKYSKLFIQAQQEAQQNNRGLWAGCLAEEKSKNTLSIITKTPLGKDKIICFYNAYNCSDFLTQDEAQSVFEYCGGIDNDIHRLDADKDGLACEALPQSIRQNKK